MKNNIINKTLEEIAKEFAEFVINESTSKSWTHSELKILVSNCFKTGYIKAEEESKSISAHQILMEMGYAKMDKMYSEEEVEHLLIKIVTDASKSGLMPTTAIDCTKNWFNKNKK